MPTSTFWNQVRLLTPPLEPLITLAPADFRAVACLPWDFSDSFSPTGLDPGATLVLETPPLSLVRTQLPWRLTAWRLPAVPGLVVLQPVLTDPMSPEPPDDRLWCAVIEVLAGTGHRRIVLVDRGEALSPELGDTPVVWLRDHMNWTRDNYLVGYPVEDDTPSRFIDTQSLYVYPDGVTSAIGCLIAVPALQTPAERAMARSLGGEVLCGSVGLLALLAHFRQMQSSVVLRLPGCTDSDLLTAFMSL